MQQPAPKTTAHVAVTPAVNCEPSSTTNAVTIASAAAPVVLSLIALVVAIKANRINHGQAFVGRALDGLVGLRAEAREVDKLYDRLFKPFTSRKEKTDARIAFTRAQEEVTMHVEYFAACFDELQELKVQWDAVVDIEDSHAASDATTYTGAANVPKKKAEAIARFIEKTAECVRVLRGYGRKKPS
jgi:hypothetical protein